MNFQKENEQTSIHSDLTRNKIILYHPPGTFKLTRTSKALLNAIEQNEGLLHGIGTELGSGIGCLSIFACKTANIEKIYGLEISERNIAAFKINIQINELEHRISILRSDSYKPFERSDLEKLEQLRGRVFFILANPPSSQLDHGLGYRRKVLKEGQDFLVSGGRVFLNVSFQFWNR
jgi:tRNA1(Val) A37 N6-methylase TrmN6